MLNKVAKLSLVSTSLAPICLTLWFVEFSKQWQWSAGSGYLLAAILLTLVCGALISLAKRQMERLPVEITSVKTVDKEIVGFFLVYLLPLINQNDHTISIPVLIFVALIFFFIVLNSHAYHFNPLLGVFGYHFYEVTIAGGICYVLITKQNIADCKSVSRVVQLTEYMILDTSGAD